MLNKGEKIEFDCPNCEHKLTFTVGQLQSGETIICQNCRLKLDTEKAQKTLQEVENNLKNFGKKFKKTINIDFKL